MKAQTTGGWQTKQRLTLLPVLVDKSSAMKNLKLIETGSVVRWMRHR